MTFIQQSLDTFLNELAANTPTPGGGTAAALAGALGASLVTMVASLTLDKKGYENVHTEFAAAVNEANALRAKFAAWMDADSASFDRVMIAFKMPRDTDEQKTKRTAATQEALKEASEVPLEVATACARLLELARLVAEKGNKSAVCDAGTAALLAEAGMRAAVLNVEVNLKTIHDDAYTRAMRERVAHLANRQAALVEILRIVESRM